MAFMKCYKLKSILWNGIRHPPAIGSCYTRNFGDLRQGLWHAKVQTQLVDIAINLALDRFVHSRQISDEDDLLDDPRVPMLEKELLKGTNGHMLSKISIRLVEMSRLANANFQPKIRKMSGSFSSFCWAETNLQCTRNTRFRKQKDVK